MTNLTVSADKTRLPPRLNFPNEIRNITLT